MIHCTCIMFAYSYEAWLFRIQTTTPFLLHRVEHTSIKPEGVDRGGGAGVRGYGGRKGGWRGQNRGWREQNWGWRGRGAGVEGAGSLERFGREIDFFK